MSVKCGKGHRHETADDVRRCYNGETVTNIPEDFIGSERATRSQVKFLGSLLAQARLQPIGARQVDQLGKREASGLIDQLKHYNRALGDRKIPNGLERDLGWASADGDTSGHGEPQPEQTRWQRDEREAAARTPYPDVPAGHYAVNSLTGNNDLDFFRVDRPKDGRWAGRTFVKRVIGGKPDVSVRGATARAALEAILKAGPDAAAQKYGQEIGRCSKCNRHLTDEISRQRGKGPDCWAQASAA